mgnify:CR=1 FL=1
MRERRFSEIVIVPIAHEGEKHADRGIGKQERQHILSRSIMDSDKVERIQCDSGDGAKVLHEFGEDESPEKGFLPHPRPIAAVEGLAPIQGRAEGEVVAPSLDRYPRAGRGRYRLSRKKVVGERAAYRAGQAYAHRRIKEVVEAEGSDEGVFERDRSKVSCVSPRGDPGPHRFINIVLIKIYWMTSAHPRD